MNIDLQTLKQYAPYAQYQIVDVVFGAAHQDVEIRHALKPPTPEHIDYAVLRQAQAATIYHDMTGNRKPWREGVITLRSNVAGARVTLLLTVSHEKRELITSGPVAVNPPLAGHTHDAADVVSGEFDLARLPVLSKAKQHAQTAYKDEANIFTTSQTLRFNGNPVAVLDRLNTTGHTSIEFQENNALAAFVQTIGSASGLGASRQRDLELGTTHVNGDVVLRPNNTEALRVKPSGLVAPNFVTASGSVSTASGTWTALFTPPAVGLYIVYGYHPASSYAAWAMVAHNIAGVHLLTHGPGSGLVELRVNSGVVEGKQISGTTIDIHWAYTRLGG